MKRGKLLEISEKGTSRIQEDEKFEYSVVHFVIFNENAIIVGFENDEPVDGSTLYLLEMLKNGNEVLTRIRPTSELDDDESIMVNRMEGYLLRYLGLDFEIAYVDTHYHFEMWDFFDEFIYDLDYFEDGMHKYLAFAKSEGITEDYIRAHSLIVCNDIYKLFPINDRFNGVVYSHILKQKIDDKEVCLSYIGSLKDTKNFKVVFIYDDKVCEMADFDNIQDAAELYMKVYDQMVTDGRRTAEHVISYMSDFIKEVRKHGDLLP